MVLRLDYDNLLLCYVDLLFNRLIEWNIQFSIRLFIYIVAKSLEWNLIWEINILFFLDWFFFFF